MEQKINLLIADKIILAVTIILIGLLRPDYVVISIFVLLFPYLIFTKRRSAIKHLVASSFIAFIWIIFSNNQYQYNNNITIINGINLFPLFAWSIGLFASYIIYSHWEHKLNNLSFINKLLLFSAMYFFLLILVESLAYHVFDIRNILTSSYSGLPLCNCIHAPRWMQVSYFLLGPIYFTFCKFLGLENPHMTKARILKKS